MTILIIIDKHFAYPEDLLDNCEENHDLPDPPDPVISRNNHVHHYDPSDGHFDSFEGYFDHTDLKSYSY